MCLVFLALNHNTDFKVIVAANRDEFYARKTSPAAFWTDQPSVLGGRDLEAAGTWMAMHTNGKIALVTNYRDPANIKQQAPSRGKLVSDFLIGDQSAEPYLNDVKTKAKLYNGFNLLVADVDQWWYTSNYTDGIQKLEPGIHGLSNHLLNTPWPKVETGKESFAKIIQHSFIPEDLFAMLADEHVADDHDLPDTGIGRERERALSARFIKTTGYGTRCSTVLLIDYKNRVQYIERTYNTETFKYHTRGYRFGISAPPIV
ncbi:MAG: NRDE family protein [Cyclobacteriaceae bacterium]|nr:NRDE family protein [Cyclobacteriaceae bacterium]